MITFRRKHLDRFLDTIRGDLRGVVLDIGGEKKNNRSRFAPPFEQVESWEIVNIDAETGADIIASADAVPKDESYADVILMTELLEHVPDPDAVLKEAARLLKPGGTLFATMPFLYQVHGDPHDYTRWTADALQEHAERAGFEVKSLEPMGGLWAVIYDLIRAHLYRTGVMGSLPLRIKLKALRLLAPVLGWMDKRFTGGSQKHITTGWALTAIKS